MRLIVNCSPLCPPLTGIGRYVKELLLRLVEAPEIESIEGFYFHRWLSRDQIRALLHEREPLSPRSACLFARKTAVFPGGRKLYRFALGRIHRRRFAQRTQWLYWETNYLPLPFKGKIVTTVYDLSHRRFPQMHPSARVSFFDAYLPDALEKSIALLTISDFSAREIRELYGVDGEKIMIVPPGVSPAFHPRSPQECESFRRRYDLPERYLLSVATLEPRKNLKNLCLAYASLDDEVRGNLPLVVAGASGWLNGELEAVMAPLMAAGEVIVPGYFPSDDLPLLYAAAAALCYVSLYEGYGMPIAEAIASGIPLLTSDRTSMPEAGGDRAWYADPSSVDSIARTLREMIASSHPLTPSASVLLPPPRIHSWQSAASLLMEQLQICYNGTKKE